MNCTHGSMFNMPNPDQIAAVMIKMFVSIDYTSFSLPGTSILYRYGFSDWYHSSRSPDRVKEVSKQIQQPCKWGLFAATYLTIGHFSFIIIHAQVNNNTTKTVNKEVPSSLR